MYTNHFDLTVLPFENVPDPRFFFDQGDYTRIRHRIDDSLMAGRGLIVVSGPIGSGKTTESQIIISDLSVEAKIIWMAEPAEDSSGLFLFVAQELGLRPETSEKVFVLRDIRESLLKLNSEGQKCILIIDEAHQMTDDLLNGVRLLNNLEEGPAKLIQLFLLGQEELLESISRPEMENFKQRISTLEILGKMNSDRIREYITHRLKVAGASTSIFTDTGWEALIIAFASESIPRVVNLLCDKSLNVAYERGKTAVDAQDVYEATKGMKAKGLEKEVFHYIVALKNLEKKHQAQPPGTDSTVEDRSPVKEPEQPSNEEFDNVRLKHEQTRLPRMSERNPDIGFSMPDRAGKSIKLPVILLLLSITALVGSLLFYCQRAESTDLMACIMDLVDSIDPLLSGL